MEVSYSLRLRWVIYSLYVHVYTDTCRGGCYSRRLILFVVVRRHAVYFSSTQHTSSCRHHRGLQRLTSYSGSGCAAAAGDVLTTNVIQRHAQTVLSRKISFTATYLWFDPVFTARCTLYKASYCHHKLSVRLSVYCA